ncbi:ABC-three component system protein [Bradyrhizobium sp. 144]|uniref:ABC-three component system protein n=1 Tax=Bradyrhizobium sp. 144 TaxID=2782620 RepID=UPI001FF8A0E2|nr:ABC-three component system protein [Bradyrhizobium sp. 144]MCK1698157.1 hypothetical protein [Bradyrhizobium sp. 144]
MTITPIQFASAWLDGAQAHVALAQLFPYPLEVMLGNGARPEVLAMLRELLSGARKLQQIVTQDRPAILVLPEVAISFSDWVAIDAMVRDYPSPLMLVSGFSVTSGADLLAWLEQPSTTIRRASWTDKPPVSERVYNGGWCWVHTTQNTECVAFLKLTSEQRDEVFIDGLDQGTDMLCLEFRDLIVFPVICSDFLQVQTSRTIAAKISERLNGQQNDDRKVLVVGLLAQSKGHLEWRNAITDVARQIDMQRVNLCLVNWAFDFLEQQEDHDRWRAYSGVYVASARQPGAKSFKIVKRFSTDAVHGAVTRISSGCVVGGPIRWNFTVTARNIWTVAHGYAIQADGTLDAPFCDDPLKYELSRLIRRSIVANSTMRPVVDALEALKDRISAHDTSAIQLMNLTLFGGTKSKLDNLTFADDLHIYSKELDFGLRALAIAALTAVAEWQTKGDIRGQLKLTDSPHAVLIWSSPDSPITVKQELDRLRIDPMNRTPTIVFLKTLGGPLPISRSSHRRIDIAAAPTGARSISEPKSENPILQADLDALMNCLAFASTQEAISASAQLIAEQSDNLKAQWRT